MMRRISMAGLAHPARVVVSVRPRRVFGPAAELLSFAGPNESNQSKRPKHTFVKSVWRQTGAAFESPRSSDRFLADPSSRCDFIGRKSLVSYRCCSSHRLAWVVRSKALGVERSPFEPPEIRRRMAASQSQRRRPELRGLPESGALTQQMSGQVCIQALCFGDFHLCQQMEVTRPPGRDPATDMENRPPRRNPARNHTTLPR